MHILFYFFARLLDGKPKATNTTGLTGQIIISVALGLVGFLTFCVLRTRWIVMFAPRTKLRRYTQDTKTMAEEQREEK